MIVDHDLVRAVELGNKPPLHTIKSGSDVSYVVVESDGKAPYAVLILRPEKPPQISRYCLSLGHAKSTADGLAEMGRALESKMGKRVSKDELERRMAR